MPAITIRSENTCIPVDIRKHCLFDEVVVVGKEALEIKKALDVCDTKYAKTFSFMDNEEVALYLMAIMRPEDVVLIKGSHGMKMDEIVKILTN